MGNEILDQLPYELCHMIVDELYLEDLLRIRLVCRSWYRKLGHHDICLYALKKYFFLPIDCYYQNFKLRRPEDENENKENWQRRFMISRIRREHGIALRTFQLTAGIYSHNLDIRYTNGLIATLVDDRIVVENLFTRKQRSYGYPSPLNGIERWALFGQYMIMIDDETDSFGWKVCAMELISGNLYDIRLSTDVYTLSAYRNQVGIVCLSSDNETGPFKLLVWEVGGSLMTLPEIKHYHNLPENDVKTANLFFYTKDKGRLTQTQHEIINTFSEPYMYRCALITNDNIISIQLWENHDANSNTNMYNHVTYNMNNRKFDFLDVHLNPTSTQNFSVVQSLIWRDQIYNLVPNGLEGLQVYTISKGLTDLWDVRSSNAPSLIVSPMQSSIMCSETRKRDSSNGTGSLNTESTDSLLSMWCDDSFLIIQCDMSIKVWQFEDLGLEPSSYGKNNENSVSHSII